MNNQASSYSELVQESAGASATLLAKSNRSGGPQTAEGKKRASMNALKTGVYSPMVVLPGENEADFEELVSLFCQDLQAAGPVELMYARQLAALAWKRMRLEQLEHRVTLDRLDRYPTLEEFHKVGLRYPLYADNYLKGFIKVADDEIPGYRARLEQVEGYKDNGLDLEELKRLKTEDPLMYEWIADVAGDYKLANTTPERIVSAKTGMEGKERPLLESVLYRIAREIEGMLWVPDHQPEIDAAIAKVRDLRVMELMQMNVSKRAFDDLAREFDRVLAQLNKQQDWRQRRGRVIDATVIQHEGKQNV
jgi:hypothetical protein